MIIRNARELGSLVRDARKHQQMTQADLASRAGVSRKWLIGLEAGKRTSELSLVIRTLNALSIDLNAKPRDKRGSAGVDIDEIVDTGNRSR